MTRKKTIAIEYQSTYLPTSFSELNNGYFKAIKSHTNSGGTYAILKSNIPSFILTPNVSHIKSKEYQKETFNTDKVRVLYIYKGSNDKLADFYQLQEQGFIVHVYTTYNRFVIDKEYIIKNFKDSHRLVADEFHILTTNEYMKVTDDFIKLYKDFKTVILTTATPSEIDLFKEFLTINFINTIKPSQLVDFKQFSKRSLMINQAVIEVQKTDKHVIVISNDIKIHANLFYNNDNIVGAGLEKKVAIYNPNDDYKEIDYNKRIHVLSSSAWEGLDFTEECIVVVLAEYSNNRKGIHKWVTKIDLIQSIGRSRKATEKALFFYIMQDGFLDILKADNTEDIYTQETNKGIASLFAKNINRDTKAICKTEYQGKAEIPADISKKLSAKEIFKNISVYHRTNEIIENIFDHINLSRIIRIEKDLSSSKGKQYGLNETEASLMLIYKVLKDAKLLQSLSSKKYSTNHECIRTIIADFNKGIALANNTNGFLNTIVKEFSEVPKRPSTFVIQLANHFTNGLLLETDAFLYDYRIKSEKSLYNQHHEQQYKRDRKKVLPVINIIGLSNISKRDNSLNIAIQLKVNEKDNTFTSAQYKRNHKQFLIERLIAFNGLNHLIELERQSRKYSTLTSHPKELRAFTTLHTIECDISTAYPTIVGNYFSEALGKKMQEPTFDIYSSATLSRSEMKVEVNKTLNQHTEYGFNINQWRFDLMKYLHMNSIEAIEYTNKFNTRGAFFEYATVIEAEVINNAKEQLNVIGSSMYRLHDALEVFGANGVKTDKLIGLDSNNNKYQFKISA